MTQRKPKRNRQGGVLVAQLGARMHYAVPYLLEKAGMLDRLHVDICGTMGWPMRLARLIPRGIRPRVLRGLLERQPRGVPAEKIVAHTRFGLAYAWRRYRARNLGEMGKVHLEGGQKFCRSVCEHGFGRAAAIYAYNSAALELFQTARRAGLKCILEQTILPRALQFRILREEHERFPTFEDTDSEDSLWQEHAEREEAEWLTADAILCGSKFVGRGIADLAPEVGRKIRIVPYGVETPARPKPKPERRPGEPIRVLFVGQVGLRKGAHYLIEAARTLRGENVEFRLVGRVALTESALRDLPPSVDLTGYVPRSEIARHYEWADVFCLPSLVEGSATVTYEAMAAGLPIIATPNAGSLLRGGETGIEVPIRSANAIAEAILRCRDSPLSVACADPEPEYSLHAYGRRLTQCIGEIMDSS